MKYESSLTVGTIGYSSFLNGSIIFSSLVVFLRPFDRN